MKSASFGSKAVTESVCVVTQSRYVSEQSIPKERRYVFAYTIVISNEGPESVRLDSRKWIIQDATGHIEKVEGPGVIGEFPHLKEGESYEYTSFCILATQSGSMRGSYQFTRDCGERFYASIAEFRLVTPALLN